MESFLFLDDNHIMLTRNNITKPQVVEIIEFGANLPSTRGRLKCVLHLPAYKQWKFIDQLDTDPLPKPGFSYFSTDFNQRLIVFKTSILDGLDLSAYLIVTRQGIINYLANVGDIRPANDANWSEWGSSGILWLEAPSTFYAVPSGMKLFFLPHHADEPGHVYDFYLPSMRWKQSMGAEGHEPPESFELPQVGTAAPSLSASHRAFVLSPEAQTSEFVDYITFGEDFFIMQPKSADSPHGRGFRLIHP